MYNIVNQPSISIMLQLGIEINDSFEGMAAPASGHIVGYAAIVKSLGLRVPSPEIISLITHASSRSEIGSWLLFPKAYHPTEIAAETFEVALYKQLVFAIKYEGINLLVFSQLAKWLNKDQIEKLVSIEPTGQYSRKIWFILEWITGEKTETAPDLSKRSYVKLVDENLQYGVEGKKSPRHMIINNLPGNRNFCPMVRRTELLIEYENEQLEEKKRDYLSGVTKEIIQRTSAFLLLKDSKASFTIEGESPKSTRAARWGKAIGQAGTHELTKEELNRLQQIVIEDSRFVDMGFRKQGGFIGEHERSTGEPIPNHISAKWEDLDELTNGLIEANHLMLNDNINAVIAAASIAFGFVFIHPFEDGNGRIHRYLIHHILAKKGFANNNIIFPVSSSILDHIDNYRKVLESYSQPLLDFIEWEETHDHNVSVLNDTKDYYRYFDATRQAEFLFYCVKDTVENVIPNEVQYLKRYDTFKAFLENTFEMPDNKVSLLVRFLEQNKGSLSKIKREKTFSIFTNDEVKQIEGTYKNIFERE